MQNNEVKAILISLGDEPNMRRASRMRMRKKRVKGKQYSRTNRAVADCTVAGGLVFLALDTALNLLLQL